MPGAKIAGTRWLSSQANAWVERPSPVSDEQAPTLTSPLTVEGVLAGRGRMQKPADNPLERLRSLCLAFPETVEIEAWGHPNFRAGKRTFAAFEWWRGRPGIAMRVDPFDQADLLQSGRFFAPPHGQGRWLAVWADEELDWALLEELLETSYRSVALARMIRALDARPARLTGRRRRSRGRAGAPPPQGSA